ncbi:MAG: sensor histidine kinase [Candidatus Hermodarchaeota archaeon]
MVLEVPITEESSIEVSDTQESIFAPWMLDVIVHDIRNFNNVALNYLSFLKEISPEGNSDIINTIIRQINYSTELLSTIEKISHNDSPPRGKRIDLGVVIQQSISQAREMFPSTPLEIISFVEPFKYYVHADSTIFDLFINLVSNAIKYSPQSLKRVQLCVEELPGSKYVLVQVADEGRGIPDSQKLKIFERFTSRIPGDKIEGRGLGLSIALACAERMGGIVVVKDRTDGQKGSVFEVLVPIIF